MSLRDRVQGSPVGMKDYPPHNDGGKLLTCIFPLRPVSSNSTMFTGWKNKHSDVFIPWKVNHAYLFCSSQYSYHWYSGDKNHDKTIPPTPPTYGKVSTALYQITQSVPFKAIAIPIIPPTQE